MSKYAEYTTDIREPQHLVAALKAMGYAVEQHAQPQTLHGYAGETRQANIIVRKDNLRKDLWSLGDIGFLKGADGSYKVVMDDMTEQKWINRVKQNYTEQRTLAIAKAKGYVFRGREVVNGKVKLLFAVR